MTALSYKKTSLWHSLSKNLSFSTDDLAYSGPASAGSGGLLLLPPFFPFTSPHICSFLSICLCFWIRLSFTWDLRGSKEGFGGLEKRRGWEVAGVEGGQLFGSKVLSDLVFPFLRSPACLCCRRRVAQWGSFSIFYLHLCEAV